MIRRTKIVCTIGPATKDYEIIKKLIEAGMNVARINFSHGSHEQNKILIDNVKKAREELNVPVAIMLDTTGPEIRIGKFQDDKAILLTEGQKFTLTTREVLGNKDIVTVNYKGFPQDITVGTKILLDDGIIELKVDEIKNTDIICSIINGESLSNNKRINVPNVHVNIPSLTEKDIDDIKFGIENDIDFVAASYIRSANDVFEIRKVLNNNGGSSIMIISKIENGTGVTNVDEIIKASDGIMVARGDLGVEIPMEEIPIVQKSLIKKSYRFGKPVITATQMLDSMIRNPRPTRAEVTDIANAIYDGTSAIMLSGETASGKYPVESVIIMDKVARETEKDINYVKRLSNWSVDMMGINVTNAISHATCTTAHDLGASAILAVTRSGSTARMVSKFRPSSVIIAATPNIKVQRQLSLSWGILPLLNDEKGDTMEVFESATELARMNGLISVGDLIVITGGMPSGITGTTNVLKVHIVGDVLAKGVGIGTRTVTGILCVAKEPEDAFRNFFEKNILVATDLTKELLTLAKKSTAIVIEQGISTNIQKELESLGIPMIINVKNATQVLKQGIVATVSAKDGIVYSGVAKAN